MSKLGFHWFLSVVAKTLIGLVLANFCDKLIKYSKNKQARITGSYFKQIPERLCCLQNKI